MIEKVFFTNSKGHKLCGILSNATSYNEKPLIVLCHGFSTNKDGRTYLRLEKSLNEQGLSTFRFDFFGHGESDGQFEDITVSEAVDDIHNAIRFSKSQGYRQLGLVGSSFGGMACLMAASKSSNLFVLALKSPVSDYFGLLIARDHDIEIKNWKERGSVLITGAKGEALKLNYSFYEDACEVKGYKAVKRIKIPTLIVHGNKDETVPLKQSIKSARLIEKCQLEIIEGADHVYSKQEHFEKMLNLVTEFVIKTYNDHIKVKK